MSDWSEFFAMFGTNSNAETALAEHQAECNGELDHNSENCDMCLDFEDQIVDGK